MLEIKVGDLINIEQTDIVGNVTAIDGALATVHTGDVEYVVDLDLLDLVSGITVH